MNNKKTTDNSSDFRFSNFLINASNQANIADVNELTTYQINSLFIFIDPYRLEDFQIEDTDLEINMDEKGHVWINNQEFQLTEIKPGISVFGFINNNKEDDYNEYK